MNKSDNEILCKDCNKNYINKIRFEKYGICLSCQRRKTLAKTTGSTYIKYVDLPQSEKDRLEKQRETNNKWARKKTAKNKSSEDENKLKKLLSKVDKLPDELLVKKFLDKYKYSELDLVCLKSSDMYSKFKNYCKGEKYQAITQEEFNKILGDKFEYDFGMLKNCLYNFKGMNNDEWVNYVSDIKSNIKSSEATAKKPLRCNQIYTPELIEEIKEKADGILTVKELRLIFKTKYPELNITEANFNNIIARHKIPHARRSINSNIEERIIVNPIKANKIIMPENNIQQEEIKDNIILQEIQKDKDLIIEKPIIEKEVDEDGDPIRLVPIKEEVVSVLDEKFKKENAKNKFNYTVDDYINMLEMFEYLSANIDGLIRCRDKQFNIVNDYQFDIVHEMENELAEEGNTYLQDKMYVMRDYRRYMEIDYKALKQLRPVLKLIKTVIHPSNPNNTADLKSMSGCINSLKQIIKENAQPKFVPRVDVGMTKKYDWAVNKNSIYKKALSQDNKQVDELNTDIQLNNEDIVNNEKLDLGKELDYIDEQIKESKPMQSSIAIVDRGIKINASLRNIKSNIKLSDDELKKGFAVYRVSCKISGGGFGVFRPWYKDYSCIKEEIAMAFAQQEFAKMKSKNGSLLFTEVECHKLNVI